MPYFGSPYFGTPYFGPPFFGSYSDPVNLEAALGRTLRDDATLAAIVAARVYPLVLPESIGNVPALYYRVVGRVHDHDLDGARGRSVARVQLGGCSPRYADTAAIAKRLGALLDGFAGTLGAGVRVTSAHLLDEADFYEDLGDGTDQGRFHRAIDFSFACRETVPAPLPFAGSADDLESALLAAVGSDATIATVVGDRVFPGNVPESAILPALWYQLLGRPRERTLDGPLGLARARWRWGATSRSYADVAALSELLRQRFQGFRGAVGNVSITAALARSESDSWVAADDGTDQGLYVRFADFEFQHRE